MNKFYGIRSRTGDKIIFEREPILHAYLRSLPEDKRLEITIKKYAQKRSNQQRKFYWAVVVKMIADHCGMTPQEAHDALKWMFLKEQGEYMVTVKSTAKLTTKEFIDYIEQCNIWAAEFLGLVLPDPAYPDE